MQNEFPYQIVTFLGEEPAASEPVYYGENGWYPQLALKRRFRLNDISETHLVSLLQEFFAPVHAISITTGALVKPERMPVRVIDIINQDELKALHAQLISKLDGAITSRYPERDGEYYYPHITAEHNGTLTIPADEYTDKDFNPTNIWLLKDTVDANSRAYIKIK